MPFADVNEALAPFRVLRGTECDILPDGRLDLPDSLEEGVALEVNGLPDRLDLRDV